MGPVHVGGKEGQWVDEVGIGGRVGTGKGTGKSLLRVHLSKLPLSKLKHQRFPE